MGRDMSRLTLYTVEGFISLLLFVVSTLAYADKPLAPESIPGIKTVNASQTIELILNVPKLIVVDARLPEEYLKGHIENSISLVDSAINKETLAQIIDNKETPVLFYCNGPRCLRSSHAAQKAQLQGYTNIYWFRDGWDAWIKQELPVAH